MKKNNYNYIANKTISNYNLQKMLHPVTSVNTDESDADLYNSSIAFNANQQDAAKQYSNDSSFIDRIKAGYNTADKIADDLEKEGYIAPSIGRYGHDRPNVLTKSLLALGSIFLPKDLLNDNFHDFMAKQTSAEKDAARYKVVSSREDYINALDEYKATLDLYGKEYNYEKENGISGEATAAISDAKRKFDLSKKELYVKSKEGIEEGNKKEKEQEFWDSNISKLYKVKSEGDINFTDPDTYLYRLPGLMGSSSAGLGWQIASMAGNVLSAAGIGAIAGGGATPLAITGAAVGAAAGIAGIVGSRHNESAMEAYGGYRDKVNKYLDSTKGISKNYVANVVRAQLRKSNPNNFAVDDMSQDDLIDLALTGQVTVPNKKFGDIVNKATRGSNYIYNSNNTLMTSDLLESAIMVMPVGKLLPVIKPLSKAITKVGETTVGKVAAKVFAPRQYISDLADKVGVWGIKKFEKDAGAQIAKKGVFDKVTGIGGKLGLVTLTEAQEEGVQDMIRDSFNKNNSDESQSAIGMWLDNTGRAFRSTYAAFTPWDPVYSSDKQFINDYKGGALLGGFMSALGIGARNYKSIVNSRKQYKTDKMLGTLLANNTAAKDAINKGDIYASYGKNGRTQMLNTTFDTIKSFKPDWIEDSDVEDERKNAVKIANMAARLDFKKFGKDIGIDLDSKDYDRFISLYNYYSTESDKSTDEAISQKSAFDKAIDSNKELNDSIKEYAKKLNIPVDELKERVRKEIYNTTLTTQEIAAKKLSDLKKKYAEQYGISTTTSDLDTYIALLNEEKRRTKEGVREDETVEKTVKKGIRRKARSANKYVKDVYKKIDHVTNLVNMALADENIANASKNLASSKIQSAFDYNNMAQFLPKYSVTEDVKLDENGEPELDKDSNPIKTKKIELYYSDDQKEQIKKNIKRSLNVSEEDDKLYNEASVPDKLKAATDEEKAKQDEAKDETKKVQEEQKTVIPAPVGPVNDVSDDATEKKPEETTKVSVKEPKETKPVAVEQNKEQAKPEIKPSEPVKTNGNVVSQPKVENATEGLKTRTTADSKQSDTTTPGRKQISDNFEKLRKSNDPIDKINAIHEIQETDRLSGNDKLLTEKENEELDKASNELHKQGYNWNNVKAGQKYSKEMNTVVLESEVSTSENEGSSITSVSKPEITKDGKVVQASRVAVRLSVKNDEIKEELDSKSKQVTFTEETHEYTDSSNPDVRYTSVTQLKETSTPYKFYGKGNTLIKETAAKFGKYIHSIFESIFKSKSDDNIPMVQKIKSEFSNKILEEYDVIGSEQVLVDKDNLLAGTADLILRNKKTGKILILDYKTEKEKEGKIPFQYKLSSRNVEGVTTVEGYFFQLQLYKKMLLDTLKQYGFKDSDVELGIVPVVYTTEGANSEITEILDVIHPTKETISSVNANIKSALESLKESHTKEYDLGKDPVKETKSDEDGVASKDEADKVTEEKPKPVDVTIPKEFEQQTEKVDEKDITEYTVEQTENDSAVETGNSSQIIEGNQDIAVNQGNTEGNTEVDTKEDTESLEGEGNTDLSHLLNHIGLRNSHSVARLEGFSEKDGFEDSLALDKALCTDGFINDCELYFVTKKYKGKDAIYCVLEYKGKNKKFVGKKYVTTVFDEDSYRANCQRINNTKPENSKIDIEKGVEHLNRFRNKILGLLKRGYKVVPSGKITITNGKFNNDPLPSSVKYRNRANARFNLITPNKIGNRNAGRVVGLNIPTDEHVFEINPETVKNVGISFYDTELKCYVIRYPSIGSVVKLVSTNTAGGLYINVSGLKSENQWLPGGHRNSVNVKIYGGNFSKQESELLFDLLTSNSRVVETDANGNKKLIGTDISVEPLIDLMVNSKNYTDIEHNKTIWSYLLALKNGKYDLAKDLEKKIVCVTGDKIYISESPFTLTEDNKLISNESAGINLSDVTDPKVRKELVSRIYNNLDWNCDKGVFISQYRKDSMANKLFDDIRQWFASNSDKQKLEIGKNDHDEVGITFDREHFMNEKGKVIDPMAWMMLKGHTLTEIAPIDESDIADGVSTSVVREPFIHVKDVTGVKQEEKPNTTKVESKKEEKPVVKKRRTGLLNQVIEASKDAGPNSEQTGESTDTIDTEAALKWLDEKLGIKEGDGVSIIRDAVIAVTKSGMQVMGRCKLDCILLSTLSERGTEYHEAWHRVANLLISDKLRNYIYNRYRTNNKVELSDKEIDEIYAEMFKNFMLSDKSDLKYDTKNWFTRILNFIKIWKEVGNYKLAKIYYEINTGKFANAKVSKENVDRFKSIYANSGPAFKIYGKKFKYIPNSKVYNNIITGLYSEILSQSSTLENVKNVDFSMILDEIKDLATNPEVAEKYRQLYTEVADNFENVFLQELRRKLKKFSILTIEEDDEENEKDTADSNKDSSTSTISDYIDLSYEKSKLNSLSCQLKLVLSTVPRYIRRVDKKGEVTYTKSVNDTTGLSEMLDYRKLFNELVNNLYKVSNKEELLYELNKRAQNSILYQDVLLRLADAATKDKYIYDKLVVLLHCHKHNFITITWNKENDGFTYDIKDNTVDKRALTYPRIWSSYFISNTGVVSFNSNGEPILTKKNGKILLESIIDDLQKAIDISLSVNSTDQEIEQKKTALITELQKIGIFVDEKALNTYIENAYSDKEIIDDKAYCIDMIAGNIKSYIIPRLNSLLEKGKNGGNVTNVQITNNQSVQINKLFSKINFVLDLSKAYAKNIINDSESMGLGVDNKKLYQMSQNNFVTVRTEELSDSNGEFFNGIVKTPYAGQIQKLDSIDAQYDGDCKNVSMLLDQVSEGSSKPSLETFINFKQDSYSGSDEDYAALTDQEEYMIKLVATSKDRITLPILADKKTYFFLKGFKLFHDKVLFVTENNQESPILSRGAMERMLAYCYGDLQSILSCVKDLKSENYKLDDKDKIANYHTPAKLNIIDLVHNTKSKKKTKEPNGLRFRFLTEVLDEKGELVDLNNIDLDVDKRIELAKKLFFDLSHEQKISILNKMLANKVQKELEKCERLGIIERNGTSIYGYRNKCLDKKELAKFYTESNTKDTSVEQGKAIYTIVANHLLNTILSVNEVERIFTGDPAFYKQIFTKVISKSGKSKVYCDRSTDKIKRLGGAISTGTDCLNKQGREDFVCTEVHVQNVGSMQIDVLRNWFVKTSIAEAINKVVSNSKNTESPINIDDNKLEEIISDVLENGTEKYKDVIPNLDSIVEAAKEEGIKDADSYSEGNIDSTDGGCFISPNMYRDLLEMDGKFDSTTELAFKLLTEEGNLTLTESEERQLIKVLYDNKLGIKRFGYEPQQDEETGEITFKKLSGRSISFQNPAIGVLNDQALYTFVRQTVLNPLKYVFYGTRFENGVAVPSFDKFCLFPLFKSVVNGTNIENLYNRMMSKNSANGLGPIDMVKMDSAVKVGSTGVTDFYKKFDNTTNTGVTNDFDKLKTYKQSFKYLRHQLVTDPHQKSEEAVGTQMVKQGLSNIVKTRMYGHGKNKIKGSELLKNVFSAINKLSDIGLSKIKESLYNDKGELDMDKLYDFIYSDAMKSDCNDNIVSALTDNDSLSSLSDMSFIESKIISFWNKSTVDINLPGGAFIQRPPLAMNAYKKVSDEVRDEYVANNGNRLNDVNEDGSLNSVISINYFKDVIPNFYSKSFYESRQYLIDNNLIGENAKPLGIGYRIPTQAIASISPLRFMDVLPDNMGDTIILPEFFTKLTGSDFDVDKLFILRYAISTKDNVSKVVDFDENSLDNNTSEDQIKNFLISNYMKVLLTDSKQGELKRPIDLSSDMIKETLAEIEEDKSIDTEEFLDEYTPSFQLKKKHDYFSGKNGIAPMALQSVHHSLTQAVELSIANPGLDDEHKTVSLSRIYDKEYGSDSKQNRILDWFSGLINAFVDIAKDPYITKMNVNSYTYDILSLMLRVGFGKRAFYFLNNPAIRDLAEAWNNVSGNLSGYTNISYSTIRKNIISSICSKYNSSIEEYNKTVSLFENSGINKQELGIMLAKKILSSNSNLTMNEIKEEILKTTDDITIDSLPEAKIDKVVAMLLAYDSINKIAKDLSGLVRASQIDTKKAGNTTIDQFAYSLAKEKIISDCKNLTGSFSLEDVERFFNDTFIDNKMKNSVDEIRSLLSKVFINVTDSFLNMVHDIHTMINGNSSIDSQTLKTVSSSLTSAIKSRFFNEEFKYSLGTNNEEEFNKMFFGEGKNRKNSMARRLAAIKSKIRLGEIPGMISQDGMIANELLDRLEPYVETTDPSIPDFIKFTSKLDSDTSSDNDLINDFRDLLEFNDPNVSDELNKEIRDFANDLIAYSFYTSGDNANYNYIFKYVPQEFKRSIGYTDYMSKEHKRYSSGSAKLLELDDIMKNNYYNKRIVRETRFFTSIMSPNGYFVPKINSYNNLHYIVNDRGMQYPIFFVGSNSSSVNNSFDLYTTVQSESTDKNVKPIKFLYKLTGVYYTGTDYHPIYQITSRKGYKEGGFSVVEYGKKTIFDKNKPFIPSAFTEDVLDISRGAEFSDEVCKNNFIKLLKEAGVSITKNNSFTVSPVSMNENSNSYTIKGASAHTEAITKENSSDGFEVNEKKDINSFLSYLHDRPFMIKDSKGNNRTFRNVLQYVLNRQLTYLYGKYKKLNKEEQMKKVIELNKQLFSDGSNEFMINLSESLSVMPSEWKTSMLPKIMYKAIEQSFLQNSSDINSLMSFGNNLFKFTDDNNATNSEVYGNELNTFYRTVLRETKAGNIQYLVNESNRSFTREVPSSVISKNPEAKSYVNHSGGAYGSDTMWDQIGRKFGVTNHNHYRDADNSKLSHTLTSNGVKATVLTKEQMDNARDEVERLLGKKYPNTLQGNLQVRNYYQVKNSDGVFAIGKINEHSDGVSGGTNTAVQLGIKLNKQVYVFDLNTESWYKWDGESFKKTETPTLTKNFAGVGTRDVENYNVLKGGKWVNREEYVGDEKAAAARKAITDVYQKTLSSTNNSTLSNTSNNKQSVIESYNGHWTRAEVAANKDKLFIFTDNTDRTSSRNGRNPNITSGWYFDKYGNGHPLSYGSGINPTQAGIRGLDNAYPISTQRWYVENPITHEMPSMRNPEPGNWTDADIEEFKKVIDDEIEDIKKAWDTGKYKSIVIGQGDAFFNSRISNISLSRTPKIYKYLNEKLKELDDYTSVSNQTEIKEVTEEEGKEAVDKTIESINSTSSTNPELNSSEAKSIKSIIPDGHPKVVAASETSDPVWHSKKICDMINEDIEQAKNGGKRKYNMLYVITKHDGIPLRNMLKLNIPKFVHFSVTSLGGTKYEPGVMKMDDLMDRIEEFLKEGLIKPTTTTIRIDPIIPGVTSKADIEHIVERMSKLGIKMFKFSVMDSYGYTQEGVRSTSSRDRFIIQSMEKLGYDWDKYYGRKPTGEVNFDAKNVIVSQIYRFMDSMAEKYGIVFNTCGEQPTFITGLKHIRTNVGCINVKVMNKVLGTNDIENVKGHQRPGCSCYGNICDALSYNDACYSSCAYCYAGHSSDKYVKYYNEDGTLKDNIYTRTSEVKSKTSEYEQRLQSILDNAPRDKEGHLLAPNGKPTKLSDRQYAQVRTDEFKKWFGDWENDSENASKVVDENGEPLVVYRAGEINEDGTIKTRYPGYYFTHAKVVAEQYAKQENVPIREFFLKANSINYIHNGANPIIRSDGKKVAKRGLFEMPLNIDDVNIILEGKEAAYSEGEYLVSNMNQIKSATDNVGTFDNNNNSIVDSRSQQEQEGEQIKEHCKNS